MLLSIGQFTLENWEKVTYTLSVSQIEFINK